ncbi:type I restriction-modification system subunit M N-terminal domain-containing protein, partial [Lactobacillus delbrueckii subsp. lactis]|nr:type I restriction-modification system subunit M N-terminal domain-containing protein [Lactobacillus delbrueckii subsp. lactis]
MAEENSTVSLQSGLFAAADVLRSKMDANEYKNYLLGTVFYKYLSDQQLYKLAEDAGEDDVTLDEAQKIYEENLEEEGLLDEVKDELGYLIEPEYTYTKILDNANDGSFQLNQLGDAFNKLESQGSSFEGLFDDYDLYSKRLGQNLQKQTDTIAGVIKAIGKLELVKTPGDT